MKIEKLNLLCMADDIDEEKQYTHKSLIEQIFKMTVDHVNFVDHKLDIDEIEIRVDKHVDNLCLWNDEAGRLFYFDVKKVKNAIVKRVDKIQNSVWPE